MKSLLLGAVLAPLLLMQTNAFALASAEVRLTHVTIGFYTTDPLAPTVTVSEDRDQVLASSRAGPPPNAQFDGGFFASLVGAIGRTTFADYSYTMTVSDDGLLASGPLFADSCAPVAGGCTRPSGPYEVAAAQIFAGFQDSLGFPPGVGFSYISGHASLSTHNDAIAENLSLSGVVRAAITAPLSYPFPVSLESASFAYTFANGNAVSAVPEPGTYGLMLAGLAVFGGASRRRRAPR